jgi:hypothetical protein
VMPPLERRSMMPGLAPIGARVAPIPQRRIFRAATAGAGRAHNPLAVSGVIWPREACGSGDAATIGSLVLPVAAERGKEGGEESRNHNGTTRQHHANARSDSAPGARHRNAPGDRLETAGHSRTVSDIA